MKLRSWGMELWDLWSGMNKLNAIRLETGNSLVHDHRPEKGLFGNPRLLTGHFLLQPQGKITGGTIRLDLWNAEMRAEIQTTEGSFQLEAMVECRHSC